MENIFEERIIHISNMPSIVRREIISRIARKPPQFINNWKGFVKVTYVTTSPPKIKSIQPIEGMARDYFKKVEEEIGASGSVF